MSTMECKLTKVTTAMARSQAQLNKTQNYSNLNLSQTQTQRNFNLKQARVSHVSVTPSDHHRQQGLVLQYLQLRRNLYLALNLTEYHHL